MASRDASPIDAAKQAFEHTRAQLFPFRFERWIALGFVAFLDQCGRGGLRLPSVPSSGGNGDGNDLGAWSRDLDWAAGHVGLVVLLAAGALALIVGFAALVLWLNSRGIFMYLDNVASGRADISRPWREHAERANSLFAWRFGIAMGTLAGILVLCVGLVGGVVLVTEMVDAEGGWEPVAVGGVIVAALVGLPVLLLLVLVLVLVSLALRDFVAPLQWRAGVPCGEAIRLFWDLLRAQPVAFVLYVLLKAGFAIGLATVILLAACFTCCCALIPVVTQTLLQPLFYFERAWSIFLLRELGWDLAAEPSSGLAAPAPDARPELP